MQIITDPKIIQEWALQERADEKTIAFIPTMGFLHEGHSSLMREGRMLADHLVLNIFVNPTQFGPHEDLEKYPRDIEGDLAKAKECGVDLVFLPSAEAIYPKNFQTVVDVSNLSKTLCGRSRPGHFQGVATVVLKLFNIVQPNIALFGEKDFQQLRVIEQMVADLNLPVKIKPMPIVREADGLAKSSRNKYLSEEERQAALAISASLKKARALVENKDCNAASLVKMVEQTLLATNQIKIDYVKLCDPQTLEDLSVLELPALLAIACFVGKTRLIDNCLLT